MSLVRRISRKILRYRRFADCIFDNTFPLPLIRFIFDDILRLANDGTQAGSPRLRYAGR